MVLRLSAGASQGFCCTPPGACTSWCARGDSNPEPSVPRAAGMSRSLGVKIRASTVATRTVRRMAGGLSEGYWRSPLLFGVGHIRRARSGHFSWLKPAEPFSTTCRDPVVGSRQVCVCPACEGFPGCGSGIYPSETPDLSQPDPATRGDRANRNGNPTSRTARRASRLLSGCVAPVAAWRSTRG